MENITKCIQMELIKTIAFKDCRLGSLARYTFQTSYFIHYSSIQNVPCRHTYKKTTETQRVRLMLLWNKIDLVEHVRAATYS